MYGKGKIYVTLLRRKNLLLSRSDIACKPFATNLVFQRESYNFQKVSCMNIVTCYAIFNLMISECFQVDFNFLFLKVDQNRISYNLLFLFVFSIKWLYYQLEWFYFPSPFYFAQP